MITWLFLMPVRSSTFWMQTLRAVSVSRRAPCIVISTFWSLPFTTSAQHHKERSAPRSKSTEQLRPSCQRRAWVARAPQHDQHWPSGAGQIIA